MIRNESLTNIGASATAPQSAITMEKMSGEALSRGASPRQVLLARSGTRFGATGVLPWILGFLGGAACIAPWISRGWLWFGLICAIVALVAFYEALSVWLARKQFAPVLLLSEKGLRGRQGQDLSVPFALTGSAKCRLPNQVRVAIMAATREAEDAIAVNTAPEWLKLERPNAPNESVPSAPSRNLLWPWTPELALLRRGLWSGPRVGIERHSRFGIWRLRQWFDSPEPLRIDADLRPGRRAILRSPIYRALVAARQTPWAGHGRDFERLREYQPGDNYAEIAWRSTARRGAPVTRLFQWEQKQEVYFLVDQSRASASPIESTRDEPENGAPFRARVQRRLLDLSVETALVGATVALELGDEFGLVTYADEPKAWLRAGSGQFQFQQFRDCLLNLEPLPTTADYESLFGAIRLRLRRRAYLVLLADLAERSVAGSLSRGVGLVRSSHVVLMTSILPDHAQPAFAADRELHSDNEVYAALSGEKENQRLNALARQLRRLDVQLRFVRPEAFLRTAVEGYLEGKKEQRL